MFPIQRAAVLQHYDFLRLNIEKTITHALKQENRNPNQIAIKLQKHFISHYNMNIKLYAYI